MRTTRIGSGTSSISMKLHHRLKAPIILVILRVYALGNCGMLEPALREWNEFDTREKIGGDHEYVRDRNRTLQNACVWNWEESVRIKKGKKQWEWRGKYLLKARLCSSSCFITRLKLANQGMSREAVINQGRIEWLTVWRTAIFATKIPVKRTRLVVGIPPAWRTSISTCRLSQNLDKLLVWNKTFH